MNCKTLPNTKSSLAMGAKWYLIYRDPQDLNLRRHCLLDNSKLGWLQHCCGKTGDHVDVNLFEGFESNPLTARAESHRVALHGAIKRSRTALCFWKYILYCAL